MQIFTLTRGKIKVARQGRNGWSLLREIHTLEVEEPELNLHVGQDGLLLVVVVASHLLP